MRNLITLLKDTIVGGVLFLLPVGVVLLVLGHLLQIARGLAWQLHATLFPGYDTQWVPLLIALAVLVGIALVAGLIARTGPGRAVFRKLETAVLSRLPVYPLLRQTLDDMPGVTSRLSGQGELEVVSVRFEDCWRIGFRVESRRTDVAVIYLPTAPSALQGEIVIVEPARVSPIALKPAEVVASMRRLGADLLKAGSAVGRA